MKKLITILLLVPVLSCSKEQDNYYKPFIENLDSLDINPKLDYDYFEFRIGPNSRKVFISKVREGLNQKVCDELNKKFDSISVKTGFSKFPHLLGFHYVLSQYQNETKIWNTTSGLKTFLGEIDTETEAQIYIMSLGFPPMINDTARTGVKRKMDKFIVRASRMDSLCNPIVTNRYTFSIDKRGLIDTLEIKMVHRDEKGCI